MSLLCQAPFSFKKETPMFTQISIDLLSVEEGDQTIGIRIDSEGGELPAYLILKGKFDLPDKNTYPFDHACFDKLFSVVREVFEAATRYPGFNSSFPEYFRGSKLHEPGHSMISMT
jgi:hypothetical protein